MNDLTIVEKVKSALTTLRGQEVILSSDVARLYGVETKAVNQAVKNNPEKFPEGFTIELTKEEWDVLRSKILTLEHPTGKGRHPKYLPKAFTEKGLYMLATILKSPVATQTTLAIINTFAEVRELKRKLLEVHEANQEETKKSGMNRIGEILADLIMPELETTETQSSLEFNFMIGKLKHSVTRQRKVYNSEILLREKVGFAKRLMSKGLSIPEIVELSGLDQKDLENLEGLSNNR